MKKKLLLGCMLSGIAFMFSCTKPGSENTTVSTPPLQIGQPITTATHSGPVKGTMLSGNTYTITGNLIVPQGDTLFMQSNVRLNMGPNTWIIVHGTFISLGTSTQPNYISSTGGSYICDPSVPASASDPAYAGLWGGILCDSLCPALVLKWTHVEFGGAGVQTANLVQGSKAGDNYTLYFVNANGFVILEDDWFYGGVDDYFRFQGGKVAAYRNTWEKNSLISGDNLNAKHGTVGDMAFNFFIGTCTNGTKASDKGSGNTPQCNIDMYNNTYVNGGYRQSSPGRSGAIDYEQGAKGLYYNNLLVDCKYGPRVVNTPVADTANMKYGNSWQYGDDTSITNQFYPVGYITRPQSTDVPAPSSFLPTGYQLGNKYDGTKLVGQNDPQFVNYPLPNKNYANTTSSCPSGGFDFHLKSTSPCIGKGYTGFTPLAQSLGIPLATAKNPVGLSSYQMPGKDIGCYQSDGSGNQHSTW